MQSGSQTEPQKKGNNKIFLLFPFILLRWIIYF